MQITTFKILSLAVSLSSIQALARVTDSQPLRRSDSIQVKVWECSNSGPASAGTQECLTYLMVGAPESGVKKAECRDKKCVIPDGGCMTNWVNETHGCVGPTSSLHKTPENYCSSGAKATDAGCVCQDGLVPTSGASTCTAPPNIPQPNGGCTSPTGFCQGS